MAELGKSIGLSKYIQMTLKKVKEICVKANTSYTYITLADEWDVPNSVSAQSCWNCGSHDDKLTKCRMTNN